MKIGTAIVHEGLVFGYDSGYPTNVSYQELLYYKGRPTSNSINGGGNRADAITAPFIGNHAGCNAGGVLQSYENRPHVYRYYCTNNTGYAMLNQQSSIINTSGNRYTYSFDYKVLAGVGGVFSPSAIYKNGYKSPDSAGSGTDVVDSYIQLEDGWTRFIRTYVSTYTGYNYFRTNLMTNDTTNFNVLFDNFMVQEGYPTAYTPSSRSNTNSLIDFNRTTTLDVGNLSFDSNGFPYFDGTNDRIFNSWPSQFNIDDNTTPRTWEVIVKPNSTTSWHGVWGHKAGAGCSYYCNGGIYIREGYYYFVWYDNATYRWLNSGVPATANQYTHVVATFDSSSIPRIYVNGALKATYTSTQLNYSSGMIVYDVGYNSDNGGQHYFSGEIPVVKFYKNKALSLAEVQQNYLAYKKRFNL